MAIICDECGEQVSSLRTICFVVTGIFGGMYSIDMFSNNHLLVILGGILGLGVGIFVLWTFNPKHIKHTLLKKFIRE